MSDIVVRLRKWFRDVNAVSAIDLMDEAAAEIERLRLLNAGSHNEGWISVAERLPPHGVRVFVAMASRAVEVMRWREDAGMWEWWDGDIDDLDITHWMPLPEPPEVK